MMKESKYFSCKEKSWTNYNYPKKRQIITILENISEDSDSQGKK